MKLGYVIFRIIDGGVEEYVANSSIFAFATAEHPEDAELFDTARGAYGRAGKCGLAEWKVGLR